MKPKAIAGLWETCDFVSQGCKDTETIFKFMNLLTANHGGYPRIGDQPEQQVLRRTIAECDRGNKSEMDVRAAEDRMTKLALHEQIEAGLDVVTDGLIRWNDPISHLAGKLSGVRLNGLLRFFDTNFYFRQPVVDFSPQRPDSLIVDDFRFGVPAAKVRNFTVAYCAQDRLSVNRR